MFHDDRHGSHGHVIRMKVVVQLFHIALFQHFRKKEIFESSTRKKHLRHKLLVFLSPDSKHDTETLAKRTKERKTSDHAHTHTQNTVQQAHCRDANHFYKLKQKNGKEAKSSFLNKIIEFSSSGSAARRCPRSARCALCVIYRKQETEKKTKVGYMKHFTADNKLCALF